MVTRRQGLKRGLEHFGSEHESPTGLHDRYESQLKEFVLSKLVSTPKNLQQTAKATDLTIGLEQEFFLFERDGGPVSHEAGQKFLTELAREEGWYIREQADSELGRMILKVSLEDEKDRYTVVKYDHHPHLFEIAFAYQDDLTKLSKLITRVTRDLEKSAIRSKTLIGREALLNIPGDDPRVVSPLLDFKNLRYYRGKLFEARNLKPAETLINYAAVIAATQVHIGGTRWWERSNYVEWLYCLEPEVLKLHVDEPNCAVSPKKTSLYQRWEGYADVFAGYPLVGFPRMERWNLDSWIKALLSSPLAGGCGDWWAGKTLSQLDVSPFQNWDEFLVSVRDLQIIRPKMYGTLEFRADPAQSSTLGIMLSAALRLGFCSFGLNREIDPPLFSLAQKNWWDVVRRSKRPELTNAFEIARQGLISRGFGEEHFLRQIKS